MTKIPISLQESGDLTPYIQSTLPRSSGHFWAGRWHEGGSDTIATFNPSTGDLLADIPCASQAEVNAAVASAKSAFPTWAETPPLQRGALLREAARRVRLHSRELALLDAANCGNPVHAMQMDAEIAATQLDYFSGLVLEIKGETIPTANGSLNYTLREPLGPVARIFPFNHPFMFAAGKIAAPLAAGNTVILKPPEQAPLSTIRLLEILEDLFPPGVLNCVTGGRETGAALSAHTDVAAVALIGSVGAGKAVLRSAADTMKHTLLELGGKNAMVIYPDAELDRAVEGAVRGMNFTWCGQSCGSTSRLYVHRSIHDTFMQRVVAELAKKHRPGIATHSDTTMGAMASRAQYERALHYIRAGIEDGATLLTGGCPAREAHLQAGLFIEPTIFTGVLPDMRIAREEIFGPVLSVFSWEDENQMFADVNAVELGLTASVWTTSLNTGLRAAKRIQAGYVWVNECSAHIPGAPFGGYKQSGVGREESKEELLEFTQVKNVNVRLD
ncbi:aldehyde dehydrogenase [Comamonas thiooxydans]|uniref:4-(hydroxymethyl)benzenesulfonate dehydrogenase n=1 Tax=Comamonas testosteroni TK102 TaxID=1392005 RepID=A0A076PXB6_COMTE|nr:MULTISPECIES: aldehyde dehydrogenase family protein [Comamonas]AIJ48450.1 aldehyde dehydrogenase [Comamonas testosteroni TK102]MPS90816.1 aldehyde dehydrogenase family protein [Comamonas sp.]TYK68127.1 aldehyde dehydrogenase family protein [Comamonas sp. Z3]BDB71346.1 aldehyde dehydrogenase [Comamonas thiooxydans]